MGRALRIEYEGAVYHVTNRGNGQESDLPGRSRLESLPGHHGRRRLGIRLANLHILPDGQPLPSAAGDSSAQPLAGDEELDQQYTRRYNWRYEHSGHVFQGRYWSGLVLNDNYLIDAASYLLLNPVRAQLVHSPEEWRWSSCAAMAGLVPSPSWLDMDWLPIDYRSAPGDPNGPFLSYVRECAGKPRPANLETQHYRTRRTVKTTVSDTMEVHN